MVIDSKTRASASPASACAHLRSAYNDCFNRWYSEKFAKGQWDKLECVSEWDKYRACLAIHLKIPTNSFKGQDHIFSAEAFIAITSSRLFKALEEKFSELVKYISVRNLYGKLRSLF